MKTTKWLQFLLLYCILILLCLGIFNFIIDPYQNNNYFSSNINKLKFFTSKNAINSHIKDLNYNKYTLVFGTSRSLRVTPDIINDKIITLNYVYGNPYCVNEFLLTLNDRQISNINRVIYNLSNHVFGEKVCSEDLNINNYSFIDYFNLKTLENSFRTIYFNLTNKYYNSVSNYGYVFDNENIKYFSPIKLSNRSYQSQLKLLKKTNLSIDSSFKELNRVDAFMKKNSIDILYYTDMTTDYYFSLLHLEDIILFNKRISENVDEFYAFNYIENFSDNYNNFSNASHATSKGMNEIFHLYTNKKYLINKNTINSYINFLIDKHNLSKVKIDKFYRVKQ